MQVTSNIYSNYNQITTVKKTAEAKGTSFASMVSVPKDTVTEKNEASYIQHMEKLNRFDSLSQENKILFKEILQDNDVSTSEIDSLSYEQASLFFNYLYPPNLSKEEIDKLPIVSRTNQIGAMLFTTRLTNDDTFNEALYRTAREIDDFKSRSAILGQVRMNVAQAIYDYDTLDDHHPGFAPIAQWDWDYETMDIDFSQFLNDVTGLLQHTIDTTKSLDFKKQQQMRLDGYNIVSKHYYDILSENT